MMVAAISMYSRKIGKAFAKLAWLYVRFIRTPNQSRSYQQPEVLGHVPSALACPVQISIFPN